MKLSVSFHDADRIFVNQMSKKRNPEDPGGVENDLQGFQRSPGVCFLRQTDAQLCSSFVKFKHERQNRVLVVISALCFSAVTAGQTGSRWWRGTNRRP